MRTPILALSGVLLTCAGCVDLGASVQAGYARMQANGTVSLTDAGSTTVANQDLDSALGLGDAQNSPYVRGQVDFGTPVLTVSAFQFREEADGTLSGAFGGIASGSQVHSDLAFANIKTSLTFDISLGPITIAPGVAIDVFDLDLNVNDLAGASSEDLSVTAPIPLAFLRGQVDLGLIGVVGEFGYLETPRFGDLKGTFWDADLMVEVRPMPLFHLFAGYRYIHIDGSGVIDKNQPTEQDFAANLDVSGWMIGGGVRF